MNKGVDTMLKTIKNIVFNNSDYTPAIYSPGDLDKPLVLMAHGLMGSKNEYLDTLARITERLDEINIASLRIDFCGHGDSTKGLDEFSFSSQVQDLSDAVEWTIKQKYKKIFLLGISFGAPPSIAVSNIYKEYVDNCILIAPVLDYKKTFITPLTVWGMDNFGYKRIIDGLRNDGLKLDTSYVLSKRVLLDMMFVDIPSYLKSNQTRITIFHGNCDNMVPLSVSEELNTLNDNINLVIMNNTEHGITEVGDESFTHKTTLNNLKGIIEVIHRSIK